MSFFALDDNRLKQRLTRIPDGKSIYSQRLLNKKCYLYIRNRQKIEVGLNLLFWIRNYEQ